MGVIKTRSDGVCSGIALIRVVIGSFRWWKHVCMYVCNVVYPWDDASVKWKKIGFSSVVGANVRVNFRIDKPYLSLSFDSITISNTRNDVNELNEKDNEEDDEPYELYTCNNHIHKR